jgi:hypothetical protein
MLRQLACRQNNGKRRTTRPDHLPITPNLKSNVEPYKHAAFTFGADTHISSPCSVPQLLRERHMRQLNGLNEQRHSTAPPPQRQPPGITEPASRHFQGPMPPKPCLHLQVARCQTVAEDIRAARQGSFPYISMMEMHGALSELSTGAGVAWHGMGPP